MVRIEWHADAVEKKVIEAVGRGLDKSAEQVLKTWHNTIPYASGELASHLQTHKTGDLERAVTSTGPYARRQELDESLRHPDPTNPHSRSGRKAHAGRDALADNEDKIRENVEADLKEAL